MPLNIKYQTMQVSSNSNKSKAYISSDKQLTSDFVSKTKDIKVISQILLAFFFVISNEFQLQGSLSSSKKLTPSLINKSVNIKVINQFSLIDFY